MALRLSTESLARVSARHPWPVIAIWLIALAAAIASIALFLGSATTNEIAFTNEQESQTVDQLLEDRLRGPEPTNEVIIVRAAEMTVDDPEFKTFVEETFGKVSALGPGIVAGGTNYYQSQDEALVSRDRHTTILPFVMAGDHDQADDNISEVLAIVDSQRQQGFEVLIAGNASIQHDFQETADKDLARGEALGVPLALIVLVLVFGAVTAALIPLGLGIVSIAIAIGISALIGQQWQLAFAITNVISMLGLAVGIDYALFIVSRYRESRIQGLPKFDAIEAAGATASRAVFFSGMMVALSLLGMFIVPATIFRSLAAGGMIVLMVSVLSSLTLLPAILGLLGDKINALRVPIIGRGAIERDWEKSGGFWDRVTKTVMHYPVASLVVVAALLIAIAIPYIDINTGSAGVSTLPAGTQARQGFEMLEREFSFGLVSPAEVAIEGDIDSASVQNSLDNLAAALATDPSYSPPALLQVNGSHDVGLLSVPIHGDPTGDEAVSAIERLREVYIPAAFDGTDVTVLVGGLTAYNMDYYKVTSGYTPIVFVFVLGLSFILLMIVFRSLVVPIKAIIMNLLSVGAAYGLLVLVFQKGIGNEILGFQKVDVIEAWVPLWLFSILFGLSMDYHVFLLSRIRERFNRIGDNAESVAFGLRSTAGLITGAALIMAGVFGGIAMGDLVMFQQMGFGLAVAVLLDATIVRSVLVPAAMQLLGKANWYLPSILHWLPEMRTEGTAQPTRLAEVGD